MYEPRHDKTCLREFPTRPDTNRPAQIEARSSLEILAIESRDIILSKQRTTKALIGLRECAGWSAPLSFAYDIRHIFSWPGSYIVPFCCSVHFGFDSEPFSTINMSVYLQKLKNRDWSILNRLMYEIKGWTDITCGFLYLDIVMFWKIAFFSMSKILRKKKV